MWKEKHRVEGGERKYIREVGIYLLHGEGAGSELIRQARDTP